MGMKIVNTKKFDQRYRELCAEMRGIFNSDDRDIAIQVEENVRCRAAYFNLESIRALQVSGFDAKYIVDELIRAAESQVMPPKKLEEIPEV